MDQELQDALEMSKEELVKRREGGSPAKVSRTPRADVAMAKQTTDAVIEPSDAGDQEPRKAR